MNEKDVVSADELLRMIQAAQASLVYAGAMQPEVNMSANIKTLNDAIELMKSTLAQASTPVDPLSTIFDWLKTNGLE